MGRPARQFTLSRDENQFAALKVHTIGSLRDACAPAWRPHRSVLGTVIGRPMREGNDLRTVHPRDAQLIRGMTAAAGASVMDRPSWAQHRQDPPLPYGYSKFCSSERHAFRFSTCARFANANAPL